MKRSATYTDLLARQAELQRLGNLPMPTRVALTVAFATEVGELAQEVKSDWAWWKKPGDRPAHSERVLSELADCLHFWLLTALREHWRPKDEVLCGTRRNSHLRTDELLANLFGGAQWWTPRILCELAARHGYTPDDLAHAYWEKTEVNLQRWREASS